MYILILVSTLLMLLSIIATTRFELFLNGSAVRTAYEKYMQDDERSYNNKREKAQYEKNSTTKNTQKQQGQGNQDEKPPRPSPKLNIRPLIFPNENFPADYRDFVKKTFTRLIENTYGGQSFFKDISASDFVEVFMEEAQEEICGVPIEQVSDLAAVSFTNRAMRNIYFQMIRGEGKGQGRNSLPSLLDFLTRHTKPIPIRIFLAKRPLLLAIYANASVVKQLMDYRQHPFDVYVPTPEALIATEEADNSEEAPKLAGEDKNSMDAASQEFKGQSFNAQRYPDIPDNYLDFTVSGSTPPK